MPATAIAAGLGHTCALTKAGGVKCWGYNGHDELGTGQTGDSSTPVDVSGLSSGIKAIAVGVRHSCALTSAGGVKCWGFNRGALGDGTADRRRTPVDVLGLGGGVTAVAAGNDTGCALTQAGGVKCWGGGSGLTPVDVPGLSGGVKAIAADSLRTCALTSAGGVECWGSNLVSVNVRGLSSGVTAITGSCALTSSGGVQCWGKDLQAGDVHGLNSGVTAIASTFHSCALLTSGRVKCWGVNEFGELGDGTKVDRSTPVDVVGLSGAVRAIAVGSFHSCALMRGGGAVECWGNNDAGQLGDATTVNRLRPVEVVGFGTAKPAVAIVARSVTVTRAGVAAIGLRCATAARCRGTLTLTSRRAKLGSRAFSIPAGAARAVAVKLTPRGFALLVRSKRLSARVVVFGATTATRTITLVAP